jgi:LuxR family maltose regulon positive regulatory protein
MSAVAVKPQILRTKLYPPRLPEIVTRDRLLGELEGARTAKLTSIVAGAGYGKSSLAAEFLFRLGRPFVWYHLERSDADICEFLSYLVAGLKSIHAEFGQKTLEHMASVVNVSEQSRAVLSTLIAELDEIIGEELFILLDDFHTVNDSPQITETMDFLLGHMLPNLHFIIASRSKLNLALARLRAGRELLELQEADLCFTPEETSRLFSDIFGLQLGEEDVHILAGSTEGWITGLVLFYLALKAKANEAISKTIRESGVSLSEVFDYLSKAVYESQPEAVRRFITRTSILSRMNPVFCNELLEIEDSRSLLSYMISERLFTIPLDDKGDWFRYHNGLKAFLLGKLGADLPPGEIMDLHLKAASLWEKRGEPEQALFHYMEAQDFDKAAGVFESIIDRLMQANRISFLYREVFRLPEDVLHKHPMLMLNGAQIAARFGDYERVVAAALSAAGGFEKSGEREEKALSLLRLAGAFFGVGRINEALEMITKARLIIPTGSPYWCELLAVEGTILATTGQDGEVDQLLEESLQLAAELEGTELGSRALGFSGIALFLQGRLNKAVEVFAAADKFLKKTGLTATHPFSYALLSRTYAYLDRLEEARETADKGIALGEEHGLPPMVFFNRASRAVALAYLGERDRALEDAAISAAMCGQYEDIAQVAFAEWFLGEAYELLGQKTTALKHLKRGERMVAKYGDSRHIASVIIAAVSAREMGLDKAAEEVERILEAVRGSATGMARSYAHSLLLSLYLAMDRYDEAAGVVDGYCAEFEEDIILRPCFSDVGCLLSFFESLFSQGSHLELMDRVFGLGVAKSVACLRRLEKCGNADTGRRAAKILASTAQEMIDPLVIKMLGPFEVVRGEQGVAAEGWKSKKACTVLKYLAANRHKGFIPRDVLMELLWPESGIESAQKNLNAALTAVRKTLEPEAARGESSYLVAKGDSLRLEMGKGGWTDLELFRDGFSRAAKAKEVGDFDLYYHILSETAGLYRGEFCAEDLYEDWCQSERESLKNDYVNLMKELATEHLRRGENGEAAGRLEEAIAKDPGREDLYRKQMTICCQSGNRAGIEEAYRRCSSYLRENYEVSPSQQTAELYQRLRQQ